MSLGALPAKSSIVDSLSFIALSASSADVAVLSAAVIVALSAQNAVLSPDAAGVPVPVDFLLLLEQPAANKPMLSIANTISVRRLLNKDSPAKRRATVSRSEAGPARTYVDNRLLLLLRKWSRSEMRTHGVWARPARESRSRYSDRFSSAAALR